MSNSPADTAPRNSAATRSLSPIRLISLCVLLALLVLTVTLFWTTRDATPNHSNLKGRAPGSSVVPQLVDLSPWKTAEALAPLAVGVEENDLAREAERLADHGVDQAFAAALRQAYLDSQHRTPTEEAIQLKSKVANLELLRQQDKALVDKLSAANGSAGGEESGDLEVAKAQLGLDSDELEDAQRDLDRASGDNTGRVQDELNAHEESMQAYDARVSKGQITPIADGQYSTLAEQIQEWLSQRRRYKLIEQAREQALDDVKSITAHHNSLEARANSNASASAETSQDSHLQKLQNSSSEREIMSIDDDRIQTHQQLADVFAKWSAQVLLQHRSVLHLILGSLFVVVLILIAMLLCDALVRRLMAKLLHDRRQLRTLRSMVELGVQIVGIALILLVIFGAPRETPTILGLTTAALTFALQDYIIAFLGWFTLVGKNGIHVGDWVEINNVSGEVVEFKLMSTTLLETGGLADQGHPTGRRITFMNSYAIRGKFFNFSTSGQWMWDGITVGVPSGVDIHDLAQRIEKVVEEETRENALSAEREWRQSTREENLERFFSASPVVSLRPSGGGIDLQLRFVTAAEERFELRNRLYQRVVEVLHDANTPKKPQVAQ